MTTIRLLSLVVSAVLATSCARPAAEPVPDPPPEPSPDSSTRLVLLLVVDQFRYDYLERFGPELSGGIRRLLDEGVSFDDTHHAHANTETAPGHATLATGMHPVHHGIIGNYWYRPDGTRRYAVEDDELDESPVQLLAATLGDWIKESVPSSKVFTASRKDRAAILLGGHQADAAWWIDSDTGRFESSEYYPHTSPDWLEALTASDPLGEHFGQRWQPTFEIAENDGVELGPLVDDFPHVYGSGSVAPERSFYRDAAYAPPADEAVAQLAEAAIVGEKLGQDGAMDLLGLSFSALDSVGHQWGPDSPEVRDVVLRLDRLLGELLETVDREVGLEHTLVVFSSDHGVDSIPELRQKRGETGRRIGRDEILCVQGVREHLREKLGDEIWLKEDGWLNQPALLTTGLEAETVLERAVEYLESCPGVAQAWTRARLSRDEGPMATRYERTLHPERGPDLVVQWQEHLLPTRGLETTHGSPYPWDTHVPFLVLAPGLGPGRIELAAATVDVAPTVAALAGIAFPAGIDGIDRSELVRSAAQIRPER